MAEIQKYKPSKVKQFIEQRDGVYVVDNKEVPNAATVIREGVDRGISTYITYHNADDKGVEVVVKAVSRDGIVAEEWVRLEYVTEAYKVFIQKMVKKIKKAKKSNDPDKITPEDVMSTTTMDSPWGKIPAFARPDLQIEYMNQLMKMYSFLPRIAVTKAKNRAILQLLGREFREEEEIEHEAMEINEVNEEQQNLSDKQLKYIYSLIEKWAKAKEIDMEVLNANIKRQLGIQSLKELDRTKASQLIESLKKKIGEVTGNEKDMGNDY